jgi:hypothetical protein
MRLGDIILKKGELENAPRERVQSNGRTGISSRPYRRGGIWASRQVSTVQGTVRFQTPRYVYVFHGTLEIPRIQRTEREL